VMIFPATNADNSGRRVSVKPLSHSVQYFQWAIQNPALGDFICSEKLPSVGFSHDIVIYQKVSGTFPRAQRTSPGFGAIRATENSSSTGCTPKM